MSESSRHRRTARSSHFISFNWWLGWQEEPGLVAWGTLASGTVAFRAYLPWEASERIPGQLPVLAFPSAVATWQHTASADGTLPSIAAACRCTAAGKAAAAQESFVASADLERLGEPSSCMGSFLEGTACPSSEDS